MNYNWSGFVADGVITIKSFVKLNTTTSHHVALCGANDPAIGVSQAAPRDPQGLPGSSSVNAADAAGNSLAVIGPGHTALVTAGGTSATVHVGDWLKSDASGFAVTAALDGTENLVGFALTGGVTGDDILMYVQPSPITG